MKRIAIISFNHEESSLCLAKYMAKQGVAIDYYYINHPCSHGKVPGFEFWRAKVYWGLQELKSSEIPEIISYIEGAPVRFFLITYDSSRRYSVLNLDILILWNACRKISRRHYDAINIVGQVPHVELCHKYLRGENITHTFHEIGSHQDNIASSPSVDIAIRDHTKVILHSHSTFERYTMLPGIDKAHTAIIPFGKFETILLYAKGVQLEIPLTLTKPIFLFYGLLRPYKGLDLLAQAMQLLEPLHDHFNLIVAGSGFDPMLPYFYSLSNCFVLNRYLENNEMMHLINISSVIVLPYHTASQTGVIPTVALYGKPVIATAVGAFPEMVNNGVNGFLVPNENAMDFAESMKKCVERPNILQTITNGMSNFGYCDDFDWSKLAKDTLNFLLRN